MDLLTLKDSSSIFISIIRQLTHRVFSCQDREHSWGLLLEMAKN